MQLFIGEKKHSNNKNNNNNLLIIGKLYLAFPEILKLNPLPSDLNINVSLFNSVCMTIHSYRKKIFETEMNIYYNLIMRNMQNLLKCAGGISITVALDLI